MLVAHELRQFKQHSSRDMQRERRLLFRRMVRPRLEEPVIDAGDLQETFSSLLKRETVPLRQVRKTRLSQSLTLEIGNPLQVAEEERVRWANNLAQYIIEAKLPVVAMILESEDQQRSWARIFGSRRAKTLRNRARGKGRQPAAAAAASPNLRNKLLPRSLTPFMACWWVRFKSTMACPWFVGGMHVHLSASMTAAVYAPQGVGLQVAEISRRGRPRSLLTNCRVLSRISPMKFCRTRRKLSLRWHWASCRMPPFRMSRCGTCGGVGSSCCPPPPLQRWCLRVSPSTFMPSPRRLA